MNQPDLPMNVPPRQPKVRAPRAIKCASCGDVVPPDEVSYGDRGTDYSGKPLHQGCYDGDYPEATIRAYFPGDQAGGGQPGFDLFEIYSGRNMTAEEQYGDSIGLWRTGYTRTDGWRGYYTVRPPRGWTQIRSDCSLAHSEDAKQLADFDKSLRRVLSRMGIVLVRAVCRTSNVFSAGVDYYVRSKDAKIVREAVEHLEQVYRDPERFQVTALTGKDPKDFTQSDRLIGLIGTILFSKEADHGAANDSSDA